MNELSMIQFQTEQNGDSMVSGRMLHRALEIKTPYRKWFPRICDQNEYEEGVDYVTVDKKVHRVDGILMPQDLHDHWLTVDMAKEICLQQHSEIGRRIRKQFIASENDRWAVAKEHERKLKSCQIRLAATEQENQELAASLAAQRADMEAMGNLIERANNALIMQKDAMRQQSAKIDELSGKVSRQSSTIRKMAPKADYCDRVLAAPDTYCITTIAKSYGMKAWQLNQFLHEQRVQYRLHDGWVLYAKYDGKGYTRTVTCIRKYDDGTEKVRIVTKWTQKGRQLIDKLLQKAYGAEGSDI